MQGTRNVKLHVRSSGGWQQTSLQSCEALAQNRVLSLSLRGCEITERGAFALLEAASGPPQHETNFIETKRCSEGNSPGSGLAPNASFSQALKRNDTLTELNIDDNPVGDDGVARLEEWRQAVCRQTILLTHMYIAIGRSCDGNTVSKQTWANHGKV